VAALIPRRMFEMSPKKTVFMSSLAIPVRSAVRSIHHKGMLLLRDVLRGRNGYEIWNQEIAALYPSVAMPVTLRFRQKRHDAFAGEDCRLLDVTSGESRSTLIRHTNGVSAVAFSAQGDLLIFENDDDTASIGGRLKVEHVDMT
jgi:hypothetical protein